MTRLVPVAIAIIFGLFFSQAVLSQTVSPVQSPVRPLGLQPIGQVMLSGSDARSREFNQVYLPQVQAIIREKLSSGKVFDDLGTFPLDADKLLMPLRSATTHSNLFHRRRGRLPKYIGFYLFFSGLSV